MLSLIAKRKVERLDLWNAFLMCVFSNKSYRLQMVSSRVRDATVLEAPIDSVANLALSAKTWLFICSNWVSYRTRKKAAAMIRGIEELSATAVNFQPK